MGKHYDFHLAMTRLMDGKGKPPHPSVTARLYKASKGDLQVAEELIEFEKAAKAMGWSLKQPRKTTRKTSRRKKPARKRTQRQRTRKAARSTMDWYANRYGRSGGRTTRDAKGRFKKRT